MNTFQQIHQLVSKIPKGSVSTYGTIAKKLGIKSSRVVGFALHANKNPDEIPCHRVVNKEGKLAGGFAFGGKTIQKQLLQQEGVTFIDDNTVNLSTHLYNFA